MFPGDVLVGPLLDAIFGPRKPRPAPVPIRDDRNYGGPSRRFYGWPHSYPVLIGRCPLWVAVSLGAGGVGFLVPLLADAFWRALG